MIIAVDFDGTLHTGQWPNIGAAAPYAAEIMRRLKNDGHTLIIWTSRGGELLIDAVNWLLSHDIPFDRVNDNCPLNTEKYGSNSRKVYAHCYVDDKQVGGLPTWPEIYEWVTKLEQQYKRSSSGTKF
ncbi:Hypothetical protein PEIBARAKI_6642 [Petrimonas sp. IBARAKI]|nr:Hypothetical protein PEIBARAKI_6642 [Petrimonas sp. IBARAKI]